MQNPVTSEYVTVEVDEASEEEQDEETCAENKDMLPPDAAIPDELSGSDSEDDDEDEEVETELDGEWINVEGSADEGDEMDDNDHEESTPEEMDQSRNDIRYRRLYLFSCMLLATAAALLLELAFIGLIAQEHNANMSQNMMKTIFLHVDPFTLDCLDSHHSFIC